MLFVTKINGKMENTVEDATNDLSGDEMETVTLTEVAQSQQNLYADAYAVLGASDDKNCTYSEVSYSSVYSLFILCYYRCYRVT